MSKRVFELFLFDIFIAILKIEEVAKKFNNAEALKHSFMAWDSVIREFEIIGEAANHLIKNGILDEENRVVVDFRNLLIHHYFGIDADEIWNVIQNDLFDFKEIILYKIEKIEHDLKTELLFEVELENKHLSFITKKLKEFK